MLAVGLVPGDADAGSHGDPPLGEGPDDDVGHVLVAAGEDLGQRLEERDPHPEIGEHRGELATDGPGADHGRRAWQLAQVQQLVRGLDITPVHLETGKRPRDGARGEHDVAPRQLAQRSVGPGDLDGLAGEEAADSGHDRDLALSQQARKPFEKLVDDLVLPVLADGELDGGLAGVDAELLRPLDAAEHRRRLEELLGGHATPVKAGAAHLVLLDDRHRQSRGPGVKSRGVPAGATADDNDVVLRRLSLVRWQTDHLLVS